MKIAGLFDRQYLRKETGNILEVLPRDSYQEMISCKIATFH